MGRKTWESIPAKHRPLANRINIVLSRTLPTGEDVGVFHVNSLPAAMSLLAEDRFSATLDQVFVIGGARVYEEALASPRCDTIYLTQVLKDVTVDTVVPSLAGAGARGFALAEVGDVRVENDTPFQFLTYKRPTGACAVSCGGEGNAEEMQYLDLVREVIERGVRRGDRTGVGTLSLFGKQCRYSLRDGRFPLLTTKRVFWRGVVEELLWLVKGCTDSKALAERKVHIWDANGSREFLDNLGFTQRKVGDLGPVYGHQWRHWGAEYVDCTTDYTGKGCDQLASVIARIKANPTDRRMVVCAWNVADLPSMALPPCHVLFQFYVADGELSCMMYQRSCDLGLGVPFNIASYSLLTVMIAHVCGLRPGEFVHTLGDAHVYLNHVDPLRRQIDRTPRPFPTLAIARKVDSIDDFRFEDLQLQGYKPMKTIKMQMAV